MKSKAHDNARSLGLLPEGRRQKRCASSRMAEEPLQFLFLSLSFFRAIRVESGIYK